MTCQELLKKFKEALERDELNLEMLRKLLHKCGAFGVEALRALAKKVVDFAASQAWAFYRGSVIAGRDPAAAYGRAVEMVWRLWRWFEMECGPLGDVAAHVAETVAKYSWPARWPFLVPAAVAAEVKGCDLPDAVAEALGPDEYSRLEAFLEQGEAVVEVAPGIRVALIRDGKRVVMVV